MAHLRLVAGTAVTGAGRENFDISMDEALKAAHVSVPRLEEQARAIIRALKVGVDNLTVAQLLDEVHRNCDGGVPVAVAVKRNGVIYRALSAVGIHVNAAIPDQELDVHCYGLVLDAKRLLRVCPALKPCASVLEGLTL